MLLAGAGLLMRSFSRLQEVDPGFNAEGVLIATVFLPRPKYRAPDQYITVAQGIMEQLAASPGVQAVSVATNIPFTEPATRSFAIADRPSLGRADRPVSNHYFVSPAYFQTLGIPLLRGRPFDRRDTSQTTPVAIINQSIARKFFPGQDPIGKRITVDGGTAAEIVGMVGDVKSSALDGEVTLQTYEPFAQNPVWDFTLVVRGSAGHIPGLTAAVARAISRVDPNLPTHGIRPLASLVGDSIARQRFAMTLFTVFSGIALLLAAIGTYGVMAYSVKQRTAEIGIRMALGAHTADVVRLVLIQGAPLIGLGVLAGLLGALLLTHFLESMLYGVGVHDPLTFAGVAALLSLVAAVACLLPARRASLVSPMAALRSDG